MISVKGAIIALSIAMVSLQGGSGYKLETRYPVPGNGGFDYLTIDSAARRLYRQRQDTRRSSEYALGAAHGAATVI